MKITIDDINTYRKIGDKIDMLAKAYYDEFIYCNRTYEYLGWELLKNNEIRINYSFIDYHSERCHDDFTLTIEELNGDILTMTPDESNISKDNIFIENNNGVINIF